MRERSAAATKFEALFNQSGIFAGIMDLGLRVKRTACRSNGAVTHESNWTDISGKRHGGGFGRLKQYPLATDQAAAGFVFRELPYWLGDGCERIVEDAPIRDPSGSVMFLHPIGIDITERKQAETALRAVNNACVDWRCRRSSDDAIVSKNLTASSPAGIGCGRLFNYTAEEAIGQPSL
jgi:hypothetical protein